MAPHISKINSKSIGHSHKGVPLSKFFFEFHFAYPGSHSILYLKEESKFSEFLDFVYYSEISRQNGSDPFISEKKIVRIMRFMVFKSTGSDSRFQSKNRFLNICTESRVTGQNVSKFAGLIWNTDSQNVFGDILGLAAFL